MEGFVAGGQLLSSWWPCRPRGALEVDLLAGAVGQRQQTPVSGAVEGLDVLLFRCIFLLENHTVSVEEAVKVELW